MFFTEVIVSGLTFSDGNNYRDKERLRTFFRRYYDEVSPDVFPDEVYDEYYNSLVIKVTDKSGRIVGGLLSCAPPALVDQALTLKDSASFKRLLRLTFLDMFAVESNHPEVYRTLIQLYLQTVKANDFRNVLGYVKNGSVLSSELAAAGFTVKELFESPPPLQGVNWQLPPEEDEGTMSWFYKVHPL